MVLAAGLGTRMGALCGRRPKPALPVLDEPLLSRVFRLLERGGVQEAVVNTHAFADQLEALCAEAPLSVRVSREESLLGSGGGIRAARRWLDGPDPFLVLNADMCLDLDLSDVVERHRHARRRFGSRATLVLRDDPCKEAFGTLGYDQSGIVVRITNLARRGDEVANGLFTGVQVLEPEAFDLMPQREVFDTVRDLYVPWVTSGPEGAVHAVLQPSDRSWEPVGTPRELLDVNLAELRRTSRSASRPASLQSGEDGPRWIGRAARVHASARIGRDTIVGAGAVIAPGCMLEEALVLPDARPPAGLKLERGIAFDEEIWRDG